MRDTKNIMGIPVDNITMEQALKKLESFLSEDSVHMVFTPNSEIMMAARRDPELAKILSEAHMLVADGAGVVLASKILKKPLPGKVSGYDLVKGSFPMAAKRRVRYFLLGSKPGTAEAAGRSIMRDYPGVEIAGCQHGYFRPEDESTIIDAINQSHTDILLVALGAPRQEKWIYQHRDKLDVKICIGVGGTLDVLAGNVALAPDFFRNNGLEWLYRLYKEPRRFKRMLDLPKFILLAAAMRLNIVKQRNDNLSP